MTLGNVSRQRLHSIQAFRTVWTVERFVNPVGVCCANMRLQSITASIALGTILANVAAPVRMVRAYMVVEAVFGGEALATGGAIVSAMRSGVASYVRRERRCVRALGAAMQHFALALMARRLLSACARYSAVSANVPARLAAPHLVVCGGRWLALYAWK